MVAVIDPLSGVVSMVDTLLTRLDAREAKLKERTDVADALIDLMHVMRAWAVAASETDRALQYWLKDPKSRRAAKAAWRAGRLQRHPAQRAKSLFIPEAKTGLSDVLFTYVPEFEAEFSKVLDERESVLRSLEWHRPGLLRRWLAFVPSVESPYTKQAAEVDLRAARQATSNLHRTAQQLADFITAHFEPREMTVRT